MEKPKKPLKKSQKNLVVPITRSSTMVATIQAKEVIKENEKRDNTTENPS